MQRLSCAPAILCHVPLVDTDTAALDTWHKPGTCLAFAQTCLHWICLAIHLHLSEFHTQHLDFPRPERHRDRKGAHERQNDKVTLTYSNLLHLEVSQALDRLNWCKFVDVLSLVEFLGAEAALASSLASRFACWVLRRQNAKSNCLMDVMQLHLHGREWSLWWLEPWSLGSTWFHTDIAASFSTRNAVFWCILWGSAYCTGTHSIIVSFIIRYSSGVLAWHLIRCTFECSIRLMAFALQAQKAGCANIFWSWQKAWLEKPSHGATQMICTVQLLLPRGSGWKPKQIHISKLNQFLWLFGIFVVVSCSVVWWWPWGCAWHRNQEWGQGTGKRGPTKRGPSHRGAIGNL